MVPDNLRAFSQAQLLVFLTATRTSTRPPKTYLGGQELRLVEQGARANCDGRFPSVVHSLGESRRNGGFV